MILSKIKEIFNSLINDEQAVEPKRQLTDGINAKQKVMPCRFEKLERRGTGEYFITKPKSFIHSYPLRQTTVENTFRFAYEMSFGEGGQHREHRSGGSHYRKNGEIFANAFQGKLAEFAVYNLLYKDNEINKPDLDTYGLGEWDNSDLTVNDCLISVKSTKHYGNLLLLETSDWDNQGRYIPNLNTDHGIYDYFILVRFKPDCEGILKNSRLLYADYCDEYALRTLILQEKWIYDIPGFISHDDLKSIIKNRFILPKGALLNGKTKMDAENYYVQAGDMTNCSNIIL